MVGQLYCLYLLYLGMQFYLYVVILNQLQGYANSWSFFCIVKKQLHPWTAPQRRPKGSLLQVPTSIHWLKSSNYWDNLGSFLFWTPNLSIYPNLKSASAYASSMPFFVPHQTGGKNHPPAPSRSPIWSSFFAHTVGSASRGFNSEGFPRPKRSCDELKTTPAEAEWSAGITSLKKDGFRTSWFKMI